MCQFSWYYFGQMAWRLDAYKMFNDTLEPACSNVRLQFFVTHGTGSWTIETEESLSMVRAPMWVLQCYSLHIYLQEAIGLFSGWHLISCLTVFGVENRALGLSGEPHNRLGPPFHTVAFPSLSASCEACRLSPSHRNGGWLAPTSRQTNINRTPSKST